MHVAVGERVRIATTMEFLRLKFPVKFEDSVGLASAQELFLTYDSLQMHSGTS